MLAKNFAKLLSLSIGKKATISSGRTRIIIELAAFDKGGLEKVVLDQALSLNANLFEVLIVTPGKLGHLADEARRKNLRVEKLPEANARGAYRTIIQKFAPHVAISHFSDFGYPLFHELNVPNVTFIHNIYAFMPSDVRSAFSDNDQYVNKYIAVSEKAAVFAAYNLGVAKHKIITVPNGLIIEEHERRLAKPSKLSRTDLGIRETDYVFLSPASYNLHKGHYLMANALKKVLEKRDDVKILCIGNVIYSPHVAELQSYIKDKGLADHMLMPGYYPEIQDPMRISDACLMPSFIEGWSIAMNEAMFYAKPLLLTNTGGAEEVIENSDIGILLPTEYPDFRVLTSKLLDEIAYSPREYRLEEPLACAMLEFAENREVWAAAGQRGRQKLLERYDFRETMRQYEKILLNVIENNGHTTAD